MMETYEETTEAIGEMMHQTVTGLENGDYAVELYANAQYTDGRDFASDLKDGATDVVYVSANDRRCYLTAHIGTTKSDLPIYLQPGVLTVTVPTGIEEIGNDEANAPVYDLQGRRMEGAASDKPNSLRPGFYIRGGKIIHVKR